MGDLRSERCVSLAAGTPALNAAETASLQTQTPEWRLDDAGKSIEREFRFKNYYETIAFVNALAWIANRQDHHPDLEVHYNRCRVRYSTHSVGGLSRNDFICAARIDGLLE
jgi:4a-hydroxytetrahydrobiopterin dehydratase